MDQVLTDLRYGGNDGGLCGQSFKEHAGTCEGLPVLQVPHYGEGRNYLPTYILVTFCRRFLNRFGDVVYDAMKAVDPKRAEVEFDLFDNQSDYFLERPSTFKVAVLQQLSGKAPLFVDAPQDSGLFGHSIDGGQQPRYYGQHSVGAEDELVDGVVVPNPADYYKMLSRNKFNVSVKCSMCGEHLWGRKRWYLEGENIPNLMSDKKFDALMKLMVPRKPVHPPSTDPAATLPYPTLPYLTPPYLH